MGFTARPLTQEEKAAQRARVSDASVERLSRLPQATGENKPSDSSETRARPDKPSSSSSRAQSPAARAVEDDATLAATRFILLDERQAQPERINSSIDAYNTRTEERVLLAAVGGQYIDNAEALAHNERMERFKPLGQQFAKKAIEFTRKAMRFAEEGRTLRQSALHFLARCYDDLAATADQRGIDFKKRLLKETISDPDLTEVQESHHQLVVQEEGREALKNHAEKGIQFSQAFQSFSSSAGELGLAAEVVPYARLAAYCFKSISNPSGITPAEREHYDPMVDWASQALEARHFGSKGLATALEKNIQTHEALASCITRSEQSNDAAVKSILAQALEVHIAARSSRDWVIAAKRSELERTKKLTTATSDAEFERAELRIDQDEEYKKAATETLQASSSSSRSVSPDELGGNADGYDQVAQGLERAATSQEAIHALPDVISKIKGQKTFKERAQVFLNKAQEYERAALERLQENKASAAEDSLNHATLELDKVEKAVEAACSVAAKAAGTAASF